ncbi:MAG: beta-mannosidase, partial [Muribaculaceae bacterium]|nr:beta-mannosidase [Muribaculaceae bacterium]
IWGGGPPDTLPPRLPAPTTNTSAYIQEHLDAIAGSGKPIVIEEFGFPRDGMAIESGSGVTARDGYYDYVMGFVGDGEGKVAGINFWGWGGVAKPAHRTWQPGDDYTGDPAQEDQGLNSVFSGDSTTLGVIRKHTGK